MSSNVSISQHTLSFGCNILCRYATQKLYELLEKAAQPRHASGNACIKLCFFIEQCRKSKSPQIKDIAFSPKTCFDLFNFYIEWNEKNQHRSMRQILELVASLISLHPQQEIATSIKEIILERITSIISHRSSQPLVKPAFKSLECFLSKGAISLQNFIEAYGQSPISEEQWIKTEARESTRWDSFISEVFDWLALPDVSPAAGKCLVTLFGQLKDSSMESEELVAGHALSWQRWIRSGLTRNPDALENVKNYLFPPLFKLDRAGSLTFLEDLNKQKPISDLKDQELNAHFLLQLAAIEVGKKIGLVEETSKNSMQDDVNYAEANRHYPVPKFFQKGCQICLSTRRCDYLTTDQCLRYSSVTCLFGVDLVVFIHSAVQYEGSRIVTTKYGNSLCGYRCKIA